MTAGARCSAAALTAAQLRAPCRERSSGHQGRQLLLGQQPSSSWREPTGQGKQPGRGRNLYLGRSSVRSFHGPHALHALPPADPGGGATDGAELLDFFSPALDLPLHRPGCACIIQALYRAVSCWAGFGPFLFRPTIKIRKGRKSRKPRKN